MTMTKEIELADRSGRVILVDDHDFQRLHLDQYTWRQYDDDAPVGCHKGQKVVIGRLILGLANGDPRRVHYHSHNKLDNTRNNITTDPLAASDRANRLSPEGEAIRIMQQLVRLVGRAVVKRLVD